MRLCFQGSRFRVEFLLHGDGALGLEDGLGDVAEDARFFGGEAMLEHGVEDFAHDVIDLRGRGEVSGECGDFGSEIVGGGRRVSLGGMGKAEVRVMWRDSLAAAASTGEAVLALTFVGSVIPGMCE